MGGALAVLALSAVLLGACVLVGWALRVLLGERLPVPTGVGVTAGLGIAVTACAVTLWWRVTGAAVLPVDLVVVGSALVVVVSGARALLAGGSRRAALAAWARPLTGGTDLVAIGLSLLVLLPVLPLGATFWTLGSNDFHRYVASAQVWMSGQAGYPDFAEVHTGSYEAGQTARANYEKPMTTAFVVLATRVTGTPTYRLLTPLMVVLVLVAAAALLHVLRTHWRLPMPAAAGVVAATALSLLPMTRVLNAQPGHVMVVAMLAVALLVLSTAGRMPGRLPWAALVVAGAALAAGVASNATLAVGFALTGAATAYWVLRRAGAGARRASLSLLVALGAAGALLLPYVSMILRSLSSQTGGEQGNDVPFPSPLAVLGLQRSLESPAWPVGVRTAWAVAAVVLGAVVVAVAVRLRLRWRRHLALAAVPASAAVSLAYLVHRFGAENYAVHKWLALAAAVTAPLLVGALCAAVLRAVPRSRPWVLLGALLVGAGALAISMGAGPVKHIGSDDLLALADDPRLAALDVVNIDIADYYESSMVPLVVPTPRVVVVRETYAQAEPPEGTAFLIRGEQEQSGWYRDVEPLDPTFALAVRDLALAPGRLELGADPASRANLFATTVERGGALVVASPHALWVADLDPAVFPRGVTLTFLGVRARPGTSVTAGVGDTPVARIELGDVPARWTVEVPAELIADGRLTLTLDRSGGSWRTVGVLVEPA